MSTKLWGSVLVGPTCSSGLTSAFSSTQVQPRLLSDLEPVSQHHPATGVSSLLGARVQFQGTRCYSPGQVTL